MEEEIRKKERIKIICDIIGNLEAVGESDFDRQAANNVDFAERVLVELTEQLIENTLYRNNYEFGMQFVGEKSYDALQRLSSMINNALEK